MRFRIARLEDGCLAGKRSAGRSVYNCRRLWSNDFIPAMRVFDGQLSVLVGEITRVSKSADTLAKRARGVSKAKGSELSHVRLRRGSASPWLGKVVTVEVKVTPPHDRLH